MTVAHARALLPNTDIVIHPHEPARDAAALAALARWAYRYAPIVAVDPPDGLLMDVSGCERLYGSDMRITRTIGHAISRLGLTVRLCCASTFGCAWAVSHYGSDPCSVIPAGVERDALAPLPIEALRLDSETIFALHEVGIDRIEHVLTLPRRDLFARFGRDVLMMIDRSLGRSPESITPERVHEPVCVDRAFDGPVKSIEAVMVTVQRLLDDLAQHLLGWEAGVRVLDITCERVDLPLYRDRLQLSRATRDTWHLWQLLRPRIETLHLGHGVERIALRATEMLGLPHEQMVQAGADEDVRDDAAEAQLLGELLDTLVHRLGSQRVQRIEAMASHVPERAFVMRDAMRSEQRTGGGSASGRVGDTGGTESSDRPSQLLARPEPIEVIAMTPDGPPRWLRWRDGTHVIVDARGPERIGSEWWRNTGHTAALPGGDGSTGEIPQRDYYKVQDETGRWLWVFRAHGVRRWFLHGQWV